MRAAIKNPAIKHYNRSEDRIDSVLGRFAFCRLEPTPGFVGFRCTQPNLHVADVIAKCETQQRSVS